MTPRVQDAMTELVDGAAWTPWSEKPELLFSRSELKRLGGHSQHESTMRHKIWSCDVCREVSTPP